MNQPIIDTKRVFAPEEICSAVTFIENAAAVANILVGVSMSEGEKDSVFGFLSKSLSVAAEVLTLGLEPGSGTFSDPAKLKKVS